MKLDQSARPPSPVQDSSLVDVVPEDNTSADADVQYILDNAFTSLLEMVKRLKKECKCKLADVIWKESDLQKDREGSPRMKHSAGSPKMKHSAGSPGRHSKLLQEKKKRCQLDLENVKKEKLQLQNERKQIEEMETAIKFLRQKTNEYFLQKREKAVTETGGQDEKNDLHTTMALLKPSITSALEMVKRKKEGYEHKLPDAKKERSHLEKQVEEVECLIGCLEVMTAWIERCLAEAAVSESRGPGEKNDQQSALKLPAETIVNTEFSKDEIEESIKSLGNTVIGNNGGSGSSSVSKGLLRNTTFVAVKMLPPESLQGESDLMQKVALLGQVRHPNMVTLIGVVGRGRELSGLVYEDLPNGSLEDQLLACRNDRGMSSPLKWQVRIKIIRDIWAVLAFLFLSKPPLVHGNLKASKVLLDSNFTSKLEAFGISRSNGDIGKPTTQDDVHSFGIIILQLLTGLPDPDPDPEEIVKVVEEAMQEGKLDTILDPAGNWPISRAKQLADLGLRCIQMSKEERPDLVGDVFKELKSHDDDVLTSGQDDDDGLPDCFKCSLSLEVMKSPYVDACGHTFEHVKILEWIDDHGKRTCPKTLLVLKHLELTPNWALRSAIEEYWNEEQRQKQSQPPTTLLPQAVSSSPPTTVVPSLTDNAASSSSLAQSPNPYITPQRRGLRAMHSHQRSRQTCQDPHLVPSQNSQGHTIITPTTLLPQAVSSSPPTTVVPSLTDNAASSSSLTQSPNTYIIPQRRR